MNFWERVRLGQALVLAGVGLAMVAEQAPAWAVLIPLDVACVVIVLNVAIAYWYRKALEQSEAETS